MRDQALYGDAELSASGLREIRRQGAPCRDGSKWLEVLERERGALPVRMLSGMVAKRSARLDDRACFRIAGKEARTGRKKAVRDGDTVWL